MKKQLSLLALLALGAWAVSAANLDLNQVFDQNLGYGYTENQNIQALGFQDANGTKNPSKFLVKTPILKDAKDSAVGEYYVLLWDKPMVNYISGERSLNLRNDLLELPVYSTMDIEGEVELGIDASAVNTGTSYYGVVVPVDDNVLYGKYSREFCFNFADQRFAQGEACATFDNPKGVKVASTDNSLNALESSDDVEHNAAGADMNLADISHSVKGNVITLTWTAVPGSSNVEIKVYDEKTADYQTLATVPMSQEKYEYTYENTPKELIFAFIPKDSKGKEKRYNVNVREEEDVKPEIKNVPATGPVENVLVMAGITLMLYAGYRVFQKRRA